MKGTVNYDVFYKRGGVSELISFTDSDYVGDIEDYKSTSNYVFMISEGAVTWSFRKQPIITLSTTEAEAVWMTRILKEIGSLHTEGPNLYVIMLQLLSCQKTHFYMVVLST